MQAAAEHRETAGLVGDEEHFDEDQFDTDDDDDDYHSDYDEYDEDEDSHHLEDDKDMEPFPLMKLPIEIRRLVYDFLRPIAYSEYDDCEVMWGDDEMDSLEGQDEDGLSIRKGWSGPHRLLCLARTCHELHSECIQLVYNSVEFVFDCPYGGEDETEGLKKFGKMAQIHRMSRVRLGLLITPDDMSDFDTIMEVFRWGAHVRTFSMVLIFEDIVSLIGPPGEDDWEFDASSQIMKSWNLITTPNRVEVEIRGPTDVERFALTSYFHDMETRRLEGNAILEEGRERPAQKFISKANWLILLEDVLELFRSGNWPQ